MATLPDLSDPLPQWSTKRLRLDEANFHPVGANVRVRRIDRLKIDLQHLDARLDRTLLELRVGLEIGVVHDQEVWLLPDRFGDGAGASVGAPVGIPDLEAVAEVLGLSAHDRRPAFGKVKAHRKGNEDDLLALELLIIGISLGVIVETLVFRQRAAGEHQSKRESKHHSQFHCILPF